MADEVVSQEQPVIPVVEEQTAVSSEVPGAAPVGAPLVSESSGPSVTTEVVVIDGEEFVKATVGEKVILIRM